MGEDWACLRTASLEDSREVGIEPVVHCAGLSWSIQPAHPQLWLCRYDVLNLLGGLPMHLPRSPGADPPSPTASVGFSDLPSDSEEMFYFSAAERDEITRKKKRRRLEEGRNERMRALEAEEQAAQPAAETEVCLYVAVPS